MTDLILRCIILSLVTIGICCTFWDDMIFDKAGDKMKQWIGDVVSNKPRKEQRLAIGEFWAKPLFGCYVCATFWYSIIQCLIYGWPVYLAIPAMGVSAVISQLSKD